MSEYKDAVNRNDKDEKSSKLTALCWGDFSEKAVSRVEYKIINAPEETLNGRKYVAGALVVVPVCPPEESSLLEERARTTCVADGYRFIDDMDVMSGIYLDTPENREFIQAFIDKRNNPFTTHHHATVVLPEGGALGESDVLPGQMVNAEYTIKSCYAGEHKGYVQGALFSEERFNLRGKELHVAECDGYKFISDLNFVGSDYLDTPENRQIVEAFVDECLRNNPGVVYKVIPDFDYEKLAELGYYENIVEGGWFSPDKCTMVTDNRIPYVGDVSQAKVNKGKEHLLNCQALLEKGYLQEVPKCSGATKYKEQGQ